MSFFEVVEPEFSRFVLGNAPVKEIATGFDWVEGPVWFGDLNCLLFSDIPNNRMMRWIPGVGTSVFRAPSNYSNGNTRDREGRLITCEHLTRRVTRTERDGSITVLADSYQGKRLNSPNDVIVASDGAIWFSDPHYGISMDYEGERAEQELPCNVYRIDPNGEMKAVLTDFNCPNGLAFSPDEKRLYVADTGRMHQDDAATSASSRWEETGRLQGERCCIASIPAVPMDSGWIRMAISGHRRRMAFTAFRRMVDCLGRSGFRKWSRTSASAADTSTSCL